MINAGVGHYLRRLAVGAIGALLIVLIHPGTPAIAAPADVVINELMYAPASELDGDEFLELKNAGQTAVDLSGWCFSGITLCMPAGTTIAPNGFLVVARDAARFTQTYGVTADAVYTGGLSNGGETIALKDVAGATIDSVSYVDRAPWPGTPDELGPSLELIDATADNNDPVNWAASTAASGSTARRANSVAGVGIGPHISNVLATPVVPNANQPVVVSATITGQTSAVVRYRIDFGTERTIVMQSLGADNYSATLPGVEAGHLVRYRVEATNAARSSRVPRADDTIGWHGVVARNGFTTALPTLEWFIADADYNAIVTNPTADIVRQAVVSYNGTVIDNVSVNIRGQGSQNSPKPNWKFELPRNHPLEFTGLLVDPVDEFAMQADYGDRSHGRSTLAWNSYATAGVVNAQLFQLRTQKNSQFLGLYTYMDLFDNVWRDREGYDDKQFFKAEHRAFTPGAPIDARWDKKNPGDEDYSTLEAFIAGLRLSGDARRNFLLANADIPEMINFAVTTAIVQHNDSSSKNFYLALDPVTGRWTVIPWDLDHTFGNTCCEVVSDMVTPAEPGDKQSQLMAAILAVPEWREMYFRRARTLVNEVLAPGRLEAVYDTKIGPAAPEWLLDRNAWGLPTSLQFNGVRSSLFAAVQARRDAFNSDPRVPSNQPAAPNIVINEIQHSPVGGDGAEFVELANPGSTAIDISGWKIDGAISADIQPGTVIPAGGRMTFVADDATFRSAYGSTVFVGGRFDSQLTASGTLTLSRTDGSSADSVTFGGPDWPVATGGPSLSLLSPTLDNSNPANWALSAGGGTPGAPNGGGPVATAPGAPTIASPAPGAAGGATSAIARWLLATVDGGSPITGQQVVAFRMSSTADDATVLDTTTSRVLGPNVKQYDFALPSGIYRFRVVAINAIGTGLPSARSAAVVAQ